MSRRVQSLVESVTKAEWDRARNLSRRRQYKRRLAAGALAAGFVLILVLLLLARNWPFTCDRVVENLAEETSSTVAIVHFQKTYFPHPGCIAEGVTFRRDHNLRATPLITVQKLTMVGSFTGLLRNRVPFMRADGMHVFAPPLGSGEGWPQHRSESKVVIGKSVANGATLEFSRREPEQPPVVFAIREFSIEDLGSQNRMRFQTALLNPQPPGEVRASGHLGPWRTNLPSETPIAGSNSFLDKVEPQEDFGINRARFTSLKTQETVEELSERARGKKKEEPGEGNPESVLSDLKGHVVVKNGMAKFSDLSFAVPGALVRLLGTYDLISQRIDLHGTLTMAKLSDATSGVKSFLIKALDPFIQQDHPGAPVPISITGTYSHPSYKAPSK